MIIPSDSVSRVNATEETPLVPPVIVELETN
jgi:hypothetical protein